MELLYVLLLRIVAYLEGPPKIIAFVIVFVLMSYSTLKKVPILSLNKITKNNLGLINLFGKVSGRVLFLLLTSFFCL